MSRAALRGAVNTWKEIHANYVCMQATAMQLFAHPDAKDEDVLRIARHLGSTRNLLADSRQKIASHKDYHDVWQRVTFNIDGHKL